MVGGFARIANRITRPLHSTFPAGSGARAHGLRAKAGAPFLSFFLSCCQHWQPRCIRTRLHGPCQLLPDTLPSTLMIMLPAAPSHSNPSVCNSVCWCGPGGRLQGCLGLSIRLALRQLGGVRCVPCKPAHGCGTGRLLLCAMKPAVSVQGCGQRQQNVMLAARMCR